MVSSPGRPGPPRLGLLVSKQCGTAVKRNRIKRRLRSLAGTVELKSGFDYVIIATEPVANAPYSNLDSWLRRAVEVSADA